MNTELLDSTEFKEDLKELVSLVQRNGSDNILNNLNYDLLDVAFKELIASETFATMPGKERIDMLEEYQMLTSILNDLAKFAKKYPEFKNKELLAECLN